MRLPLRVDFGGEGHYENGVITVNADVQSGADIIADVTVTAFQLDKYFAPKSISQLSAFHLIEHLDPAYIDGDLAYWLEFLAPGGELKIVTPDFDQIHEDYCNELITTEVFLSLMYVNTRWNPVTDWGKHRWLYNFEQLKGLLFDAGYVKIEEFGEEKHPTHWKYDYPILRTEAPDYMVKNLMVRARRYNEIT